MTRFFIMGKSWQKVWQRTFISSNLLIYNNYIYFIVL